MNNFELRPTDKKDHFRFFINGVDVTGEQECLQIAAIYIQFAEGMNN